MKKIYQTIIDKDYGNCMQAALASLLEFPLEKVPHFLDYDDPYGKLFSFISENNFNIKGTLYNPKFILKRNPNLNHKDRFPELHKMKGMNGYFFATVYSPKYFKEKNEVTHAVIIDCNLNIVHDPNPEYTNLIKYPLANELGYNGVLTVLMIDEK